MHKSPLKFILIIVSLIAINSTGYAQQYPVFTQYYFNELVINPAYAGSQVQLSLTAMYRNQWVNFPGSPKTFNVSAHSALKKRKMGLGILIDHDEIGSYKNEHIYANYAYKINTAKATFSMGIQAGINILGANYSDLKLPGGPSADPSFGKVLNEVKPNFGAGIYYNRKNFFLGLSVPFILNNEVAGNLQSLAGGIREARYYFLRSGFEFDLNKNIVVNPSILIRAQEGQPASMDLNTALIFYDVFSAGVSYRSVDSFITFIDLQISEHIHFGYSYDWTTSSVNKFSNGTHEFMINYRHKIASVHKNLECPKYYTYR